MLQITRPPSTWLPFSHEIHNGGKSKLEEELHYLDRAHGNLRSGSPTPEERAVTYSSIMPASKAKNVNGPTFARLAVGTTSLPIASSLPLVDSTLNLASWTHYLMDHPDWTLANELLRDITHGVHIGFQGQQRKQIFDNHLSTISNPEAVAHKLEREIALKRKIGPFLTPLTLSGTKFRLLLDLRSCPSPLLPPQSSNHAKYMFRPRFHHKPR